MVVCKLFRKNKDCGHKYTAYVDEDGYQYCILCGLARKIGAVCTHSKWERIVDGPNRLICKDCGEIKNVDCSHHWVKESTLTVTLSSFYGGGGSYYKYIYECSICGEMKIKTTQ